MIRGKCTHLDKDMPTFKNIFTYKAVEITDNVKKFLVCILLEDGEYFDEIHFDEDTGTLKFFCGDNEIKDNEPCMIKNFVRQV